MDLIMDWLFKSLFNPSILNLLINFSKPQTLNLRTLYFLLVLWSLFFKQSATRGPWYPLPHSERKHTPSARTNKTPNKAGNRVKRL